MRAIRKYYDECIHGRISADVIRCRGGIILIYSMEFGVQTCLVLAEE